MSKKPMFREALQDLKPNEPYRRLKEKAKEPMQFRAPDPIQAKSKKSEIKVSSDQNDLSSNSDDFDFITFAPKGVKVDLVEKDGEFHIPHRLFEFIHKAVSTKVEILVFSCLLRNTLGYRKPQCQVSQTFIGRWTGIASPNVRRALRELEQSGLIVVKSRGEAHHESAIYEIPLVRAFLKKKNDKKMIPDQNDLGSKDAENRDQNNLTSEIKLIPNKEIEKKEERNSLSPEIERYFASCGPANKREREWNDFQKLIQDFSEDEIAACLAWIKTHGIPNTGEVCHSPMAFLGHGIQQVLKLVQEASQKKEKHTQAEAEKNRKKAAERALELEEAQRFEQARQVFDSSFRDLAARTQFLSQEVQKRRAIVPLPMDIAERLVIMDWFQSKTSSLTN